MEIKNEIIVKNLQEIHVLADYMMSLVKDGHTIFCMNGQVGAGKTTLISHLSGKLKINDEVSSPTYSIINEYHSEEYGVIYHIDLYRLNSEEEAIDIGMEDILDGDEIAFIEWPNEIVNLLPNNFVEVNLSILEDGSRKAEIIIH